VCNGELECVKISDSAVLPVYLRVIKRVCNQVLINPIIRTRTRHLSRVPPTRDIIASTNLPPLVVCQWKVRLYYGCTVLRWALAAFSVSWSYTQSVWFLGRGISPSQGFCLHTEHKHRINANNTNIHALSGIRNHDPSVGARENSSRLRSRGRCEWPEVHLPKVISRAHISPGNVFPHSVLFPFRVSWHISKQNKWSGSWTSTYEIGISHFICGTRPISCPREPNVTRMHLWQLVTI
jgi:hypothetical protein